MCEQAPGLDAILFQHHLSFFIHFFLASYLCHLSSCTHLRSSLLYFISPHGRPLLVEISSWTLFSVPCPQSLIKCPCSFLMSQMPRLLFPSLKCPCSFLMSQMPRLLSHVSNAPAHFSFLKCSCSFIMSQMPLLLSHVLNAPAPFSCLKCPCSFLMS